MKNLFKRIKSKFTRDKLKITKHYRELADSRDYQDAALDYLGDAGVKEILNRYLNQIRDSGYVFKIKKDRKARVFRKWKNFTTVNTLTRVVWLASNWRDQTLLGQAITLGHEMVHVRQSSMHGRRTWFKLYIGNPRFRWAMEVQAYRESLRIARKLGVPQDGLMYMARAYADSLGGYFLHRVSGYKSMAFAMLMEEARNEILDKPSEKR